MKDSLLSRGATSEEEMGRPSLPFSENLKKCPALIVCIYELNFSFQMLLCFAVCLNKIKVLIGKHFSHLFKKNFGTHRHTNTDLEIVLRTCSTVPCNWTFLVFMVLELFTLEVCHFSWKHNRLFNTFNRFNATVESFKTIYRTI